MAPLSEIAAPQDQNTTCGTLSLQPDVMPADQISDPTVISSPSLLASSPRTTHFLPYGPTLLMDVALAPNSIEANELTGLVESAYKLAGHSKASTIFPAKQSSQLDSTLLSKLPRELRDKIYREAVLEDIEIPIHVAQYETKDGERRHRLQLEPALMQVCKQTRHEVADIYYLENIFRITDDLFESRAIRQLNCALHPWANKIKKLEISHEFVRYGGDFIAEIEFSVSASPGRIVIEPLTFLSRVSMERERHVTQKRMCYCKTFHLALDSSEVSILEWVQKYVELVAHSQCTLIGALPWCWNCAGLTVV